MNSYSFQFEGYAGSIKGNNGSIVDNENNNGPMAETCTLQIVQSDTLKIWRKCIKEEDLDGVMLNKVSDIVLAIQNALGDTSSETGTMKVSITFREETNETLTMIMELPYFLGTRSLEVVLEEVQQDKISILEQRVNVLTAKLKETESKLTSIQHRNKFSSCGTGLTISKCGNILSNNGNSWSSAIVEEKVKSGKYYGKFMVLKMNCHYRCYCGVVPSALTEQILNGNITTNGGIGCCLYDGEVWVNGSYNSIGLPACNGWTGSMIIGVHLNLEDNKIQFFINGTASSILDIPPGEYHFVVSLKSQWDAVKLLSIQKE